MPAAKPPEFRRRAVERARRRDKPVAQIAADLAISESCLRRWVGQLDIEEGRKEGLSCARSWSGSAMSFEWRGWR
jgi:transposase